MIDELKKLDRILKGAARMNRAKEPDRARLGGSLDAARDVVKGLRTGLSEKTTVAPVRLPEPDGKLETKAPVEGPKLDDGLIAAIMVAIAEGSYQVQEVQDFDDVETGNAGKEIAVQFFGTEANPLPHTFLVMRSIGGKAQGPRILTL